MIKARRERLKTRRQGIKLRGQGSIALSAPDQGRDTTVLRLGQLTRRPLDGTADYAAAAVE